MPSGHYPRHKDRLPPRSRSGLKGVIFCPELERKSWKAYGRQHGLYITIGYFRTKEEAAMRYNEWALKRYGPETYLNPVGPAPQQDPSALLHRGLEVLREMRQAGGDSLRPA